MKPNGKQKVARRRRAKKLTSRMTRKPGVGVLASLKGYGKSLLTNSRTFGYFVLYLAIGAAIPYSGYRAYDYMKSAPYFMLKHIELKGGKSLTANDIKSYLQLDGKSSAPNLIAIDQNRLVAALHEHPWIRSARIKKKLPNKLVISIEERRPAAYIALGRLYLVDKYGEVFKEVEPADDYKLPIITGLTKKDFKRPADRALARREIKKALWTHRVFKRMKLGKWIALSEIHLHRLLGFTFITDDGVLIRLGRGSVKTKLKKLRVLYPNLAKRRRKVRAIFLNNRRHPDRVLVRYKGMKKLPRMAEVPSVVPPTRQLKDGRNKPSLGKKAPAPDSLNMKRLNGDPQPKRKLRRKRRRHKKAGVNAILKKTAPKKRTSPKQKQNMLEKYKGILP